MCYTENRPFGIVLIKEGQEVGGTAFTHIVGCSARIQYMEPLSEGRMNIVVLGQERFAIESVSTDKSYLVGNVKALPLRNDGEGEMKKNGRLINSLIDRYIGKLKQLGDVKFERDQEETNLVNLAYLSASLLQIPMLEKQAILEINSTKALVEDVIKRFRKENIFLDAMIARGDHGEEDIFPFSLN